MLDKGLLETLVKLAAAGTSGVCIVCVFCSGYIMLRLPIDVPKIKHDLLKRFLNMTTAIAVFSAVSTMAAGYWDYKGKEILRKEIQTKDLVIAQKQAELKSTSAALAKIGTSVQQNDLLLAELHDTLKAAPKGSRAPASNALLDSIVEQIIDNNQALTVTLQDRPGWLDVNHQKPIIK